MHAVLNSSNNFGRIHSLKKLILLFFLFNSLLTARSQTNDSTENITVRNVVIEGNRVTKEKIITRELSYDVGDTYQRWQLDSMFVWDENRIYNTNLFSEVTTQIVNVQDGEGDIKITVDERWYLYPFPIFKLVDRNFNDWWVNRNRDLSRVNYGIKLTKYNFRGRAEKIRLSAQFGFETRVNVSYDIPYIDKAQRIGLNFDFNYLETKNLAYDTEDNIRTFLTTEDSVLRTVFRNRIIGSYRSSFYSYHYLTAAHLSANVADTIVALNNNYFGDGDNDIKYFRLSYAYVWDKRNNRNYPTEGEWYTLGLTKFGLGLYDDVNYWQASVSLSKYKNLGNKNYYAGGFIGEFSFPQDRSYFTYISIGFHRNVLRGYDLKIVEGSSYVIQKNELKRNLFSRTWDISKVMPIRQFNTFPVTIYGVAFFDQGYAKGFPNHEGSSALDDEYLYSYGLGLDLIMMYDAVFRFELSRNGLNQTNFFINFKYQI